MRNLQSLLLSLPILGLGLELGLGAGLGLEGRSPSIVLLLLDDMDAVLGSINAMPKTLKLLGDEGMTLTNMFVSTPVCCPSRSSYLTGKYIHNLHVLNNTISGNCSSKSWHQGPENQTYARYLHDAGYHTAFLGKYLNQYGTDQAGGVEHIPQGWDVWHGLVGNSKYYNYSISNNGVLEHHGDEYSVDYFPDLVKNRSVHFLSTSIGDGPFLLVMTPPTPHDDFTPAPQYAENFEGVQAPRTPNWNIQSRDKAWFVANSGVFGPMDELMTNFSDLAFRRRLSALQSIDDLVEAIVNTLSSMNRLEDTFIFFTSDHGYHLGQFGLTMDKRTLYDFDLRVPLLVRGPNIAAGTHSDALAISIDIAPTFLDIAGVEVPEDMDGISLLDVLIGGQPSGRTDFLVEFHGEAETPTNTPPCGSITDMQCHAHDENSYPTPPYFSGPAFCECEDSLNNTYTCVRTLDVPGGVSAQYCMFAYGFEERYDLLTDPWQLHNLASETVGASSYERKRLLELLACQGSSCRS